MFRTKIDQVLKYGMMSVLALFTILENFEFLVGQKESYVKDIQIEVEEEVLILLLTPQLLTFNRARALILYVKRLRCFYKTISSSERSYLTQ